MSKPTVSVVMAAYNGAAFLPETMASLVKQDYPDFELVVVDDCSTDETPAILRGFGDRRIRVLSTPRNSGPVAARNLAVDAARGRYIAALDQDDLSHPERLSRQVAFLRDNPHVAMLGTASRRLIDGRLVREPFAAHTTPAATLWMLHVFNPIVWSSVMIRADAARALPIFSRAERQYAEDYDLYHRLAEHGEVARLDAVLTTYRCHANGASSTFQAGMIGSATAVLTDAHARLGCDAGGEAARLMIRHIAARQPAPDVATLRALAHHLRAVTGRFSDRHRPDQESRRVMVAEAGRLWCGVVRRSLQAGIAGRLSALPPVVRSAVSARL